MHTFVEWAPHSKTQKANEQRSRWTGLRTAKLSRLITRLWLSSLSRTCNCIIHSYIALWLSYRKTNAHLLRYMWPLCAAFKHQYLWENSFCLAYSHAFACNAPNFRDSYRTRSFRFAEQQYLPVSVCMCPCVCFVGRIDCCSHSLSLSCYWAPAIDDDCNGGHEKFYTTFLIKGKTKAPFSHALLCSHFLLRTLIVKTTFCTLYCCNSLFVCVWLWFTISYLRFRT